jgi:hypothetical protein
MPAFSIAVYQPHWMPQLPKLDVFDIRDHGKWTRPRDFVDREDPLKAYAEHLWRLYDERHHEISKTLAGLPEEAALCCWCPYDKAAQRQLQQFGSFVCHSEVVGQVLEYHGVSVGKDADRQDMKVL